MRSFFLLCATLLFTACVTTPAEPIACPEFGKARVAELAKAGEQYLGAEDLGQVIAYLYGTVKGNTAIVTRVDYVVPEGFPPPPANSGITKVGECKVTTGQMNTIYTQVVSAGEQASEKILRFKLVTTK